MNVDEKLMSGEGVDVMWKKIKAYVDDKTTDAVNTLSTSMAGQITTINNTLASQGSTVEGTVDELATKATKGELEAVETSLRQHDSSIQSLTSKVAAIPDSDDINELRDQLADKASKSDLVGIYTYKGSVATKGDLPTNAKAGDVYNVTEDGNNYAWVDEGDGHWDSLGAETVQVDLSGYLPKDNPVAKGSLTVGYRKADSTLGQMSVAIGQDNISSVYAAFSVGDNIVNSGICSAAFGRNCKVTGDQAFSEGLSTQAENQGCHAEGRETISNGPYSHAEGYKTVTSGQASHAEGSQTRANSPWSHAEGSNTVASGQMSHAEGSGTTTTSTAAHAEGAQTKANGQFAHAEGEESEAGARAAHAEGYQTKATYQFAHAEGSNTVASGQSSHAEGMHTESAGGSSHAEGNSTDATGMFSHAEGCNSLASGESSHAEGNFTQATGDYSHSEGMSTVAEAIYSHAEGYGCKATGQYSHAEGQSNISEGQISHAEGRMCHATGISAHAGGTNCDAEGVASFAHGVFAVANSTASIALGNYVTAGVEQLVCGSYNRVITGAGTFFIVGEGGASDNNTFTRINAFRVSDSGIYGNSAYHSSGADYAEMMEWQDGNPMNEDRVGRFVTMVGDKIKLAEADDDFILGIVSGNPTIVGDSHEDQWHGIFERDVFGRPIRKNRTIPAQTIEVEKEDGTKETATIIEKHQRVTKTVSKNYSRQKEDNYIPRSQRKEWDAVGMLGKLVAIDDGTCIVDGWCKPGHNGVATRSDERTKFRVIGQIDSNHIRVMIVP